MLGVFEPGAPARSKDKEMKTLCKCPKTGLTSSKRVMALALCAVTCVLALASLFKAVDTLLILGLASIAFGTQAATKTYTSGKNQIE